MTDSLRDQLLGLGFKATPTPERKPQPRPAGAPANRSAEGRQPRRQSDRPPSGHKPPHGRPRDAAPGRHAAHPGTKAGADPGNRSAHARPRTREDIDLAKAYAIRAQREKDERIEAERVKQEQARERREAKARLAEFIKDKSLNDATADIARHFDYGGKIKRIYVNAEQLKALNAGALGVVQIDGRYLLVDAAVLAECEAIFPPAIALKVDANAPAADDPYADPQFQVPDDLIW